MGRLRNLSRPAWLTAGVLAGAIAVPAVTVAATATIVHVQGNGHTASVSGGGQLRTVEMDPANFVHLRGSTSNCSDLGTAPTGRALVLKSLSVSNITTVGVGDYVSANVSVGTVCGFGTVIGDAEFAAPGSHEVDLGDGVAIPAGKHVYLSVNGGNVTVNAYGYSITSDAVPGSPAIMRNIGPAKAHHG